jgi:hypothetical protein
MTHGAHTIADIHENPEKTLKDAICMQVNKASLYVCFRKALIVTFFFFRGTGVLLSKPDKHSTT